MSKQIDFQERKLILKKILNQLHWIMAKKITTIQNLTKLESKHTFAIPTTLGKKVVMKIIMGSCADIFQRKLTFLVLLK